MNVILSRSRVQTYEFECKRKEFYGYGYGGTGLIARRDTIPTAVGVALHAGLAELLAQHGIDRAVDEAMGEFHKADPRVLDWEFDSDTTISENIWLIEALLRMAHRELIPELLTTYEVVDVPEKRSIVPLPDKPWGWKSITDGVLQRRNDASFYTLSWKTVETFRKDTKFQYPFRDMQGVSEPWAYGEETGRNVAGQVMVWIKTGRQVDLKNEGRRIRDTFLTRPWQDRDDNLWWAYDYFTEKGERKRLPYGSQKVEIWKELSPEDWIERLTDGSVNPKFNPLRELFVGPMEYPRPPWHTSDWLEQVRGIASRLGESYGRLEETGNLNREFPQNAAACWDCPFGGLCWGGASPAEEFVRKRV